MTADVELSADDSARVIALAYHQRLCADDTVAFSEDELRQAYLKLRTTRVRINIPAQVLA